MRVSARSFAVIIALVLGLALAAPTYAKPSSTTITLSSASKVSGTSLPAGEYQLVVNDTSIAFKHKGKVVAEVTGQWKKASAMEHQDSVVRDGDGRILEIHLSGRDTYFVVG